MEKEKISLKILAECKIAYMKALDYADIITWNFAEFFKKISQCD